MAKKLFTVLFILFSLNIFAAEGDFEKKLTTLRYSTELDSDNIPLSDLLGIISKSANISIIAASEITDLKVKMYLPPNQTIMKIINTLKDTYGLTSEIRNNDTLFLSRAKAVIVDRAKTGKIFGKVTEIDKATGIKGVTLSLGDDVSTLQMSDVGGAFLMDNVKPGTYILKAIAKRYRAYSEIIEIKPGEDTKLNIVLAREEVAASKSMEEVPVESGGFGGKVTKDNGEVRVTRIVEITYADPKEIKDVISPIVPLDNIVVEPKSNLLILIGNEENIDTAEKLIERLDVSAKQVEIEVEIWELNKNLSNELGFRWESVKKKDDYVASLGGKYNKGEGFKFDTKLDFGTLFENSLETSLTMLESTGNANVVAKPKIRTLNGEHASFQAVSQEIVGYSETSTKDGASSKSPLFKDAGIVLEVTPTIKTDKTIFLDVATKLSKFSKDAVYNSAAEKKNEAKTKVRVRDEQVIYMGGLTRLDETEAVSKTPILGDLPIIGTFFQSTTHEKIEKTIQIKLKTTLIKDNEELKEKDAKAAAAAAASRE